MLNSGCNEVASCKTFCFVLFVMILHQTKNVLVVSGFFNATKARLEVQKNVGFWGKYGYSLLYVC